MKGCGLPKSRFSRLVAVGAVVTTACAPHLNGRTPADIDQLAAPVSAQTPATPAPKPDPLVYNQTGIASFSADELHGKTTATGEIYNMRSLVAAHPTLPLGTRVRVTSLHNGKSVVVRIVDRGPFIKDRIIDLSFEAAKQLDYIDKGVELVQVRVVQTP
ncbi:septal ring lytic transglycosylase RlpA family protein [candidate division KSB1 bacterium]|nr:septal ring lytic transglycosylase RlpA family protein [candidate division KSB1 bacterium]